VAIGMPWTTVQIHIVSRLLGLGLVGVEDFHKRTPVPNSW
jgi:hypothetical protein